MEPPRPGFRSVLVTCKHQAKRRKCWWLHWCSSRFIILQRRMSMRAGRRGSSSKAANCHPPAAPLQRSKPPAHASWMNTTALHTWADELESSEPQLDRCTVLKWYPQVPSVTSHADAFSVSIVSPWNTTALPMTHVKRDHSKTSCTPMLLMPEHFLNHSHMPYTSELPGPLTSNPNYEWEA